MLGFLLFNQSQNNDRIFSRTCRVRGQCQKFDLRGQGQGLQNLSLRILPLPIVLVDVFELFSIEFAACSKTPSHQAEIIIAKRLIQGRNNVTRVRVKPRSCDQGRCKKRPFILLATLPTIIINIMQYVTAPLRDCDAFLLFKKRKQRQLTSISTIITSQE